MTRPFRFGAQLWTAPSRAAWRDKVKKVEDLGYDVVVVADHFGEGVAPMQGLTAAADASSKLRLGTLVLDNDFRHPVVLAREVAALDVLSDGRFELGLGAGWLGRDYERSGLSFDPPPVRVERLEESLEIVTRALGGESVSFSGKHYEVSDFEVHPKPIQDPLPVMVGAGGRRMLRLAAEHADIIGILPLAKADGSGLSENEQSESAFMRKIEFLGSAAGERFGEIELNLLVQAVEIADDERAAAEKLAAEWEEPVDPILDMPFVLVGPVPAIVEKVRRLREELGFSYLTFFEKDFERFAPMLADLRGT
ncbi:MAG: TIGR03621 family F420-dependent LLM class oxidoreductase [Actinomycetota bacterium]